MSFRRDLMRKPNSVLRFTCFILLGLGQAAGQDTTLFGIKGEIPPPNFKLAFLGDQGVGLNSEAVLTLIRQEGADALVHLGDYDYLDNPEAWESQTNRILGPDFPYIAVMGNHDMFAWSGEQGYARLVQNRLAAMGVTYVGEAGLKYAFRYRGILFVLTTPGLTTSDHAGFIRDQLSKDSTLWRISAWHVNQALMQVGGKSDEAGWAVYEESRKGGAFIATAHEHSYSRTHLLQKMNPPTVASRDSILKLRRGRSFVFVSGLGGSEVRPQLRSGNWWASIYTSNQSAMAGALFATFHVDGNPRKARFQFKNILGKTIDSFTVVREVDIPIEEPPDLPPPKQSGQWQYVVMEPYHWEVPAGSSLFLQDVQGRVLLEYPPWEGIQRVPSKYRGLLVLRVEKPGGKSLKKLLIMP
jgi:Calcineurin-like phosphoesterase